MVDFLVSLNLELEEWSFYNTGTQVLHLYPSLTERLNETL